MKKTITILLCLLISFILLSCNNKINENNKNNTNEGDIITQNIIKEFKELAKIPRPSLHEEKVSSYLYDWAKKRNIEVIKDSSNNIIMDVPATEGKEHLEKIIIQNHMDMVFTSNESLDPLTTPINVQIKDDYITSDGRTSLGADDGIGLALALCIDDGLMSHGPIRHIITTDEEKNMSGVFNLDKNLYSNFNYFINLDSENADEICISSAGCYDYNFTNNYNLTKTSNDASLKLTVSNLLGGHSGMDIHKNRLNAIICLSKILNDVIKNDININLVSYVAGYVGNAIPDEAELIFALPKEKVGDAKNIINNSFENIKREYNEFEPHIIFEVSDSTYQGSTISFDDSKNIISFLTNIINGVYSMSKDLDYLVEASSNVGIIRLENGKLEINAFLRSSSEEKFNEMFKKMEENAVKHNINYVKKFNADAWPMNINSKLLNTTTSSYKKIFNDELKIIATHAALECGTLAKNNPNMDIISIGPDVENAHSVKERVYIPSLLKTWKLLEDVLNNRDLLEK